MSSTADTSSRPLSLAVPPLRERRWRLGAQLAVGLIAIAVAVALITGSIVWTAERGHLIERLHDDHARTFGLMQSALLDDMISEDVPRIEMTVRQLIARDPAVHAVILANEDG